MDLLSNRVWHLFLSMIDGEINREAWEHKVTNGGERDEHFSILGRTERFRERRETLERKRKGINTPLAPNGHLSRGSAMAQVRQCHSAVVPLSRCGTVAQGKTTKVRVKC